MAKEDLVDVLIIGAGASGAAVAWSLAETPIISLKYCAATGDWVSGSATLSKDQRTSSDVTGLPL